MKKVLIVASVVSFIEWFNKENIVFLSKEMNCEVHIACNFDYMDDTDDVRTKDYIKKIQRDGIILHNIHFARSPFSSSNIRAYKELCLADVWDGASIPEVIIGPMCPQSKEELTAFLKANGLKGTKVYKSRVSIR